MSRIILNFMSSRCVMRDKGFGRVGNTVFMQASEVLGDKWNYHKLTHSGVVWCENGVVDKGREEFLLQEQAGCRVYETYTLRWDKKVFFVVVFYSNDSKCNHLLSVLLI